MFSEDNYDTLITKAALHGARLLKKPHQASAVNLASHLWWQEVATEDEAATAPAPVVKQVEKTGSSLDDGVESPKAVSTSIVLTLTQVYRAGTVSTPR